MSNKTATPKAEKTEKAVSLYRFEKVLSNPDNWPARARAVFGAINKIKMGTAEEVAKAIDTTAFKTKQDLVKLSAFFLNQFARDGVVSVTNPKARTAALINRSAGAAFGKKPVRTPKPAAEKPATVAKAEKPAKVSKASAAVEKSVAASGIDPTVAARLTAGAAE